MPMILLILATYVHVYNYPGNEYIHTYTVKNTLCTCGLYISGMYEMMYPKLGTTKLNVARYLIESCNA